MNEQNNKKANMLCWISVACMVIPFIISVIMGEWTLTTTGNMTGIVSTFYNVFSALLYLARIVGFGIMIYVRMKYPKNLFGKVLMWIYIIMLVLLVLLIIFIAVLCNGCVEGVTGCVDTYGNCN